MILLPKPLLFSKICKGIAFLIPLAGIALFGALVAQEPRREQGKNPAPQTNLRPLVNEVAKPDKELDAWIKSLAEKMTDRHDTIRNSARNALISIGSPALPALRQMSQSSDPVTATAAKNVANQIQMTQPFNRLVMGMPGNPMGIRGADWKRQTPPNGGPIPEGQGRPEGDRKEGDRKANPANQPREGARPDAPRPGFNPEGQGRPEGDRKEGDRKANPANPPREGARPDSFRPGFNPEARERLFKELDLNKDTRAKVEDIMAAHQEKVRQLMEKGRSENGDREKITAEMRELQQSMMKAMRETMGDEKFQTFMRNGPNSQGKGGPDGRSQGKDSPRQKQ